MNEVHVVGSTGVLMMVCAVLAAKWAMELGFSQSRQLLWAWAGLAFGPLALFLLYVRQLRRASGSARQWV